MKALIFAAGIGSRLKPWTDFHPKALVDVGGKPVIQHVIERITDAGIKDIIINLHHFGNQIRDFIHKNNSFGANILFSDESDLLLETGGGLRKAIPLLGGEPVLIHNADILSDFNIKSMIASHNESNAKITLLTSKRKTSRYLVFDPDKRLKGWKNVSTGETRPNGFYMMPEYELKAFDGVHIVSHEAYSQLIDFRPIDTPFSIMDFYLAYCNNLIIKEFELPSQNHWFDIGRPETLLIAQEFYSQNGTKRF